MKLLTILVLLITALFLVGCGGAIKNLEETKEELKEKAVVDVKVLNIDSKVKVLTSEGEAVALDEEGQINMNVLDKGVKIIRVGYEDQSFTPEDLSLKKQIKLDAKRLPFNLPENW